MQMVVVERCNLASHVPSCKMTKHQRPHLLMLQALMLSGFQVDFDLDNMAQFGFAPVLTRQLDVLRLLRRLAQITAKPDWQAELQSALTGSA